MQLIATQTVGAGGAAVITFSNIPQTYTDLYVVGSLRNTTTGDNLALYYFDHADPNYIERWLVGNGGSASSSSMTNTNGNYIGYIPGTSHTASTFASFSLYAPNYTSTTNKKIVSIDSVSENNGATAFQWLGASIENTSSPYAVTYFNLYCSAGQFAQYSTASLYGITKGSGGATVA